MKIVAINGSHRGKKGYTQFLLNLMAEGAIAKGASFETVILSDYKINPCKACRACHTERHYLKCIYDENDDVTKIFNIMKQADILIYATPIYIFNMTGLMKTFLDRITSTADSAIHTISEKGLFFHHINKDIISKPFLLITTQDNIEDATFQSVLYYFNIFSKFLDAPMIGSINRKLGKLAGHGKDKEKEIQFPEIVNIHNMIIQAGSELAQFGAIKKSTLQQANRNIIKMPFIIEKLLKFDFIRNNKKIMGAIFKQAQTNMNRLSF